MTLRISLPSKAMSRPREADHGDETISMYEPQLESWDADELHAYAALAAVNKKDKKAKYGAVWFTARTEIDKVNRQVTLDNFQITKVQFPTMKDKEAEYQAFLQAKLPGKSRSSLWIASRQSWLAGDSKSRGLVFSCEQRTTEGDFHHKTRNARFDRWSCKVQGTGWNRSATSPQLQVDRHCR